MPAVIHNLNDGLFFEKKKPNALQNKIHKRGRWLRAQGYTRDQELCLSIREVLMERVIARQWEKYGRRGTEGGVRAGQPPA